MDRKFLEDYDQQELEECDRYEKWVLENGSDPIPLLKRLIKPQEPFVRSGYSATRKSIWAQIPLAGSLILRLPNWSEDMFQEVTHLNTREIPDLIDFIKDTGKLQITLANRPLDYIGLDYLDPIFEELRPPFEMGFPVEAFLNSIEMKKYYVEYTTLGSITYFDFLRKEFYGRSRSISNIIEMGFNGYMYLQVLGYKDLVEELENRMIDDPESALHLFYLCLQYVTDPLGDPICKLVNHSFNGLAEMQKLPILRQMGLKRIHIPVEIGQFLMRNLIHYPESFEACKELIFHYNTTDLIKVAAALNQGICEANQDLINESKADLSEIMEDLWEDKSLKRKIKGLNSGIQVSIAAIGPVASAVTGGIEGFLAGLGFSVGSTFLGLKTEVLSEKIARHFSANYQTNIYDFKKKYRLL